MWNERWLHSRNSSWILRRSSLIWGVGTNGIARCFQWMHVQATWYIHTLRMALASGLAIWFTFLRIVSGTMFFYIQWPASIIQEIRKQPNDQRWSTQNNSTSVKTTNLILQSFVKRIARVDGNASNASGAPLASGFSSNPFTIFRELCNSGTHGVILGLLYASAVL